MQEIAALEAQQAEAAAAGAPVEVEAGDEAMRLLRKECQLRDILAAQVWCSCSELLRNWHDGLSSTDFFNKLPCGRGAGEDGGRA